MIIAQVDIGRNWNTLSYTPIQSIPKMLNGMTCPMNMLAIQELGCFQLPAIVYRSLQHEAMALDEWHKNGPQDLITVFLCIQNAINKMHQTPSNVSICPLKSVTMTNCSQVEILMRTTSMQILETVSDSLCRNSLVMQTDCCSSCPGGWSQRILEVKMLDVEVQGWCGYTWSVFVRPVGCTAKFSEKPLEMAYGTEMDIQFNSSGGHSCSQHANCTLPQNL